MHLRVKRKNQTMFIWAEPTESVESLKGKIEAIVKVSITEMRLYADLLATSHVMADKETLDKLGVQPEQELALVFKLPGVRRPRSRRSLRPRLNHLLSPWPTAAPARCAQAQTTTRLSISPLMRGSSLTTARPRIELASERGGIRRCNPGNHCATSDAGMPGRVGRGGGLPRGWAPRAGACELRPRRAS